MKKKTKTKTDSQIIHELIEALNVNISILAKEINAKRGTLYQVTSGNNSLSTNIKNKIVKRYPQVSMEFLNTGEGKPILSLDNILTSDPSNNIEEEIYRQITLLNLKVNRIENILIDLVKVLKENK